MPANQLGGIASEVKQKCGGQVLDLVDCFLVLRQFVANHWETLLCDRQSLGRISYSWLGSLGFGTTLFAAAKRLTKSSSDRHVTKF